MRFDVFVDPEKVRGGNFGVDGEASALRLAAVVKEALEKEFEGATVITALGAEDVRVTPENPAVARRALHLMGAVRKTADYLVYL